MKRFSEELIKIVEETSLLFDEISQEDWNYRSAPGKWSRKEILGHLIDSAANNHQRFVRVQFEDNPAITYEQNKWVSTEDFNNASTDNLITLWRSYNKHLAYIISVIPKDKFTNQCNIGKEEPVTLEWLFKDYVKHLGHHINQIIT
ncbi:MAG: DinB family protein [Ignavibacteriales bacterium]|nr:MAG: DinB family protein [Ignavibacteriales bacterium]